MRAFLLTLVAASSLAAAEPSPLKAGAAAVDVSPVAFPVNMPGGFDANMAEGVNDPLMSRSLAISDGETTVVLQDVKLEAARGAAARCPRESKPLCGVDGVTYNNPCLAKAANATQAYPGPCIAGGLGAARRAGMAGRRHGPRRHVRLLLCHPTVEGGSARGPLDARAQGALEPPDSLQLHRPMGESRRLGRARSLRAHPRSLRGWRGERPGLHLGVGDCSVQGGRSGGRGRVRLYRKLAG